jgi:hypothetical protein
MKCKQCINVAQLIQRIQVAMFPSISSVFKATNSSGLSGMNRNDENPLPWFRGCMLKNNCRHHFPKMVFCHKRKLTPILEMTSIVSKSSDARIPIFVALCSSKTSLYGSVLARRGKNTQRFNWVCQFTASWIMYLNSVSNKFNAQIIVHQSDDSTKFTECSGKP